MFGFLGKVVDAAINLTPLGMIRKTYEEAKKHAHFLKEASNVALHEVTRAAKYTPLSMPLHAWQEAKKHPKTFQTALKIAEKALDFTPIGHIRRAATEASKFLHPAVEIKKLEAERDNLRRKQVALQQRVTQLQREMSNLQRQAAVKAQIAMDAAAIPGYGGDVHGNIEDDGKDKNNMLLYAGIGIVAVIALVFFMKKRNKEGI